MCIPPPPRQRAAPPGHHAVRLTSQVPGALQLTVICHGSFGACNEPGSHWRAAAPTEPGSVWSPWWQKGSDGRLLRRAWWRAVVAGRDQGDLVAEPGESPLAVADQVLVIALVEVVVPIRGRHDSDMRSIVRIASTGGSQDGITRRPRPRAALALRIPPPPTWGKSIAIGQGRVSVRSMLRPGITTRI